MIKAACCISNKFTYKNAWNLLERKAVDRGANSLLNGANLAFNFAHMAVLRHDVEVYGAHFFTNTFEFAVSMNVPYI